MTGKLSDIQECFRNDVDIFCINESWLNEGIDDANVKWIGNKMFRIDRMANRSGGLVTYVNNAWASHTTMVDEWSFIKDDIEIQTLTICKENRKEIDICNIYRPPNGNYVNFFTELDKVVKAIELMEYHVWIARGFQY